MSSRRGPGHGPSNSVILRAGPGRAGPGRGRWRRLGHAPAGSLRRQFTLPPARSTACSHRLLTPLRAHFGGCSIRLDRKRVKPGRELHRQRLVYCPVAGNARQAGEYRGPDPDRIMRLAAWRGAGMTVMQMRLIVDFQQVR